MFIHTVFDVHHVKISCHVIYLFIGWVQQREPKEEYAGSFQRYLEVYFNSNVMFDKDIFVKALAPVATASTQPLWLKGCHQWHKNISHH
jgi:hypothetical protein